MPKVDVYNDYYGFVKTIICDADEIVFTKEGKCGQCEDYRAEATNLDLDYRKFCMKHGILPVIPMRPCYDCGEVKPIYVDREDNVDDDAETREQYKEILEVCENVSDGREIYIRYDYCRECYIQIHDGTHTDAEIQYQNFMKLEEKHAQKNHMADREKGEVYHEELIQKCGFFESGYKCKKNPDYERECSVHDCPVADCTYFKHRSPYSYMQITDSDVLACLNKELKWQEKIMDEIWEERQEYLRNLKTVYGDKMGLLDEYEPCPCSYAIYSEIVDAWDSDMLPQIIHRTNWVSSTEEGTMYYGNVQVRCPRCGSYWQIGDE